MKDNPPTSFYCSVYERDTKTSSIKSVVVARNIDDITKVIGSDISTESVDPDLSDNASLAEETELGLDLNHFFNSMQKYYELSAMTSHLASSFVNGYHSNIIKKFVETNLEKHSDFNGFPIYILQQDRKPELDRMVSRWNDIRGGAESLAPSVLLGIVASFDSLFSELFAELLLLRPERYNSSDRQISVSDILRLDSFDSVISKVVYDEVDNVSSKPHSDQIVSFEKSFNIKVKDTFSSWPDYVEIFERRNLAAHGNLSVNSKYLEICKRSGLDTKGISIGDQLIVDHTYLTKSLDILVDLGTRLVFAAWHKQISENRENAFNAVVNITYEFIKARRFKVADNVADFVIRNYADTGTDGNIKALIVNRAIALKKLKQDNKSTDLLKETDWTAAAPIYNICVAGITEDIPVLVKLIPVVHAMGELTQYEFRNWPSFDWVRDNQEFQMAFEKTFGEGIDLSKKTENFSLETISEGDEVSTPPPPTSPATAPDTSP